MTSLPRPGLRFVHRRFRQALPGVRIEDGPPEVCRVTRTTRTSVYYRTADGLGNRYVVDREGFDAIVLDELPREESR